MKFLIFICFFVLGIGSLNCKAEYPYNTEVLLNLPGLIQESEGYLNFDYLYGGYPVYFARSRRPAFGRRVSWKDYAEQQRRYSYGEVLEKALAKPKEIVEQKKHTVDSGVGCTPELIIYNFYAMSAI